MRYAVVKKLATGVVLFTTITVCAQKKPNILVIFGDDVGITNISVYGDGVVGYKTPHLDKLARSGLRFTDYYAENSCTAGRSTFITGQCAKRTGLSKVGVPGAPVGLMDRDVTIAQA
jgi:arylsulfatase A-like enzyme